jgi:beta-lactam-binding protein with PASTA domain
MKISLRPNNYRDVLLHFIIMLLSAILLVILFFYWYLPNTTHHGQTITVPNVVGMHLNDVEDFLDKRDLQYVLDDSTFIPGAKPLTVYQQFPPAGNKVKQGRKIYLTIIAQKPPMVKMPKLLNRSLLNAQRELESYGLLVGNISIVPDLQQNAVLKQLLNGVEVNEGQLIPKGSKIDLVVGDGLGNQEFEVPDLTGKPLDEAELLLQGSNLQVGIIIYQEAEDKEAGTVLRQKPTAGNKIRVGDVIDLWVVGKEPGQ